MPTPSVSYAIYSKDKTKKGIKSAQGGFQNLGKTISRIGKIATGAYAAILGAKGIGAVVKGSFKAASAWGTQEEAVLKLNSAIGNNASMTSDASQSLQDFASELQSVTTIGDEVALSQAAMLTSIGQTESQIKSTITAAADLAAGTDMSFESAVKNISKLSSGMTGELGEVIPALKELSTEQIKAGEGLKVIQRQFGGAAEAVAGGYSGMIEQLRNTFGDTLESIGKGLAPAIQAIAPQIETLLNTVSDWFNKNSHRIANFLLNLPEIMRLAGDTIVEILRKTFSFNTIVERAKSFGTFFIDVFIAIFNQLTLMAENLGKIVFQPLIWGMQWATYGIRNAFQSVGNFIRSIINVSIIPAINGIISGLQAVINAAGTAAAAVRHPFNRERRRELADTLTVEFEGLDRLEKVTREITKPEGWEERGREMAEGIDNIIQGTGENLTDVFESWKGMLGEGAERFAPIFQTFTEELENIIGVELPDNLKTQMEEIAFNIPTPEGAPSTDTGGGDTGGGSGGGGGPSPVPSGGGGVTGLDFMTDARGALSSLAGPMGAVVDAAFSAASGFSNVTAAMQPLQTIMNAIFEILGPILDDVLGPFVAYLRLIGKLIGTYLSPVLWALKYPIELIGKLWFALYNNVIVPIYNGLMGVFNKVQKAFADFANGILKIVDKIPFVNVGRVNVRGAQQGFLDKMNWEDLVEGASGEPDTGSAGPGGTGSTGSAAQYRAQEIHNHITVNTDVILGDDSGIRQLAEMITLEQKELSGLGVV